MRVNIESHYQLGDKNRDSSPLIIEITGLKLPGITIKARTWKEQGTKVYVFYDDRSSSSPALYSREIFPVYSKKMAEDIALNINAISNLFSLGLEEVLDEYFFEICDLIVYKCERHGGMPISGYDYEVLVTFKN